MRVVAPDDAGCGWAGSWGDCSSESEAGVPEVRLRSDPGPSTTAVALMLFDALLSSRGKANLDANDWSRKRSGRSVRDPVLHVKRFYAFRTAAQAADPA